MHCDCMRHCAYDINNESDLRCHVVGNLLADMNEEGLLLS